MQIARNKVVTFEYTLTDPAGKVLDTSTGGEPLGYLHGVGGIIPGLEQALEGRSPGDELDVVVPPELAYGLRSEEMIQAVPRSVFGGMKDHDIKVGMQFQGRTEAGPRTVTVVAVEGDQVTIDANHDLAGQTLHFAIKIVGVRDATPEELAHGHVHGPEGHHH